MSTKILLLTHGNVGQSMLKAAANTLGALPSSVMALSVGNKTDPQSITNEIRQLLDKEKNNYLLVLTDLFGSTPHNIASSFAQDDKVAVVSGVNLGMLIKSINYLTLPFDELVKKAISGGKECIKTCESQTKSGN